MARDAGKDELPYGLLGYPVLQAADILCVKGQVVPVGKDNAAHVEVAREIARRFNHLYGEVFPVPEMIMSETPTLIGTDGRGQMSKSRGNDIALSDGPATVRRKVLGMYADPIRERRARFGAINGLVDELIYSGTERTRAQVRRTVVEVRRAMGLASVYTQIRRRAERYRKAVDTAA